MKSFIILVSSLIIASISYAAEEAPAISATAHVTYGSYAGSKERKNMVSETVTGAYDSNAFGANVLVRNWNLSRAKTLGDLRGLDSNLGLYVRKKVGAEGFVGAAGAVSYLTGNDSNTDQKVVPYGAITCKTPDGGHYFDLGFASMGYGDATANQLTATYGIGLLDRYLWSQTRLYYNNLNTPVQGKGHTVAVEERLTWYAVPRLFSLTLSGMAGQRIYGYDPDLAIAYTLPDIQQGGAGLTPVFEISRRLRAFGDISYASYEKRSISDTYSAVYGTLGLTFKF